MSIVILGLMLMALAAAIATGLAFLESVWLGVGALFVLGLIILLLGVQVDQ